MEIREAIGEIGEKVMELNAMEDVTVFLCIQGNTSCIALTVYEKDEQSYQRKAFLSDRCALCGLVKDLDFMIQVEQKQEVRRFLQQLGVII